VDSVLVVVGPHVPELLDLARGAGASTLLLTEPTPDMRATVLAGLDWIERRHAPVPTDAWLLSPADHPTLAPSVIRHLLRARRDHPQFSIFLPTHAGRRGHPTLVGWSHVPAIRSQPVDQGLNSYFRSHRAETLEIPVQSAEILRDLDTPEDYERLLRDFAVNAPAGGPARRGTQNR
jgi:CTP:molybdopterin cytidylyltransferase MocA